MGLQNITVLSGYHAKSHDYWYCQLSLLPFDWQLIALPPRHFSWRIRGNSLYYSQLDFTEADLVLCTSMVDIASLRGLNPTLHTKPILCYYHENQFAYPSNHQQQGHLEAQITSIYTGLAADSIAFNSHFNRDTFLNGAAELLRKMPDFVPKGLIEALRNKSRILPVPLTPQQGPLPAVEPSSPIHIVWNHRWEYDKGPDLLLAVCLELERTRCSYQISILGQKFRKIPNEFMEIKLKFQHRLRHWGYVEEVDAYHAILSRAHIALSTALHDFQGLAIMEAVQFNCIPIVPDHLAYREFLGEGAIFYTPDGDISKTAKIIAELIGAIDIESYGPVSVENLGIERLLPQYEAWFRKVLVDGADGA